MNLSRLIGLKSRVAMIGIFLICVCVFVMVWFSTRVPPTGLDFVIANGGSIERVEGGAIAVNVKGADLKDLGSLVAELAATPKIRLLTIRGYRISERAASDLTLLADLRVLRFEKCFFEGRAVAHLGQLVHLKKLSILDPSPSAAYMTQLKMALPACEVTPTY